MIGETSGASAVGAGYEQQGRAFVQYTLQPWLRKIEQELNRKLYPRNNGRFLEFSRESLYEGDLVAQAAYFRAALGGPGTGDAWMNVDEVRNRLRMPPAEGGKEIFRAMRAPAAPAVPPPPESKPAE